MTRMLIAGPQGSGKGTQGVRIAAAFDVPVVSTGDIFRYNIKNNTELGQQVKAITEAGDLVPDALTGEIVTDRLSQDDATGGFLLDGYPRNIAQVAHLDEFLEREGSALDAIILLDVPRDESVARIMQRASAEGRADDTEEAVAHRLDIYEAETAPIVDVYRQRGILHEIDGVGSMDDITERILASLDAADIRPA